MKSQFSNGFSNGFPMVFLGFTFLTAEPHLCCPRQQLRPLREARHGAAQHHGELRHQGLGPAAQRPNPGKIWRKTSEKCGNPAKHDVFSGENLGKSCETWMISGEILGKSCETWMISGENLRKSYDKIGRNPIF